MRGESYVGVLNYEASTRPARQMKGPCSCKISSNNCKLLQIMTRKFIFESFWKMTWPQKSNFVANHTHKSSYEKECGTVLRTFVAFALPMNNEMHKVQDGAVATRWTKWKRNLELYFATNNIHEDLKMRNSLLFLGGDDIQDAFDSYTDVILKRARTSVHMKDEVYNNAISFEEKEVGEFYRQAFQDCFAQLKKLIEEVFELKEDKSEEPYVRIPPEEYKQRMEEKHKQADESEQKQQFFDNDGNNISRKHMKKLKRLSRRPRTNETADNEVCVREKCGNTQGLKCDQNLCKACCRNKCYTEDLDCYGHRLYTQIEKKVKKPSF
ncbi:unnamed protein product [Diamesa hyperborea]